jgi:NAD(P)-dependent dehydrogenase (short-subunit alcohol dehydrogenase family)
MKRLENKVAVIYGNGAVGTTVAKAFAKEGAQVYLAGRTVTKLEKVAQEVLSESGAIEIAQVDAMDEEAVEKHMNEIIQKSSKVDISFNAIGLPQTGHQGTALIELTLENFLRPITVYSQSHFITAKAAAKRMIHQKQGVILMNTPSPSRVSVPFMGGMPSTWSSIEALSRTISAECGPYGVRSVCILTSAMPDTPLIDEVYTLHAKAHGTDYKQFHAGMEGKTHTKRLTSIHDLAKAAVFAASDEGKAMTGTILNLTAGLVVD